LLGAEPSSTSATDLAAPVGDASDDVTTTPAGVQSTLSTSSSVSSGGAAVAQTTSKDDPMDGGFKMIELESKIFELEKTLDIMRTENATLKNAVEQREKVDDEKLGAAEENKVSLNDFCNVNFILKDKKIIYWENIDFLYIPWSTFS